MSEAYPVAIADLTMVDIKKMNAEQFKAISSHPEGKAKIAEILVARATAQGAKIEEEVAAQAAAEAAAATTTEEVPVPTPEEVAAAEAEAARIAAEVVAAEAAAATEKARLEAEAAVAAAQAEEAAKNAAPKRFVIDFQARDEAGNPIGNRTHLEASSQEELNQKMLNSYEHAVRAVDRLKKQKPTFRKEEPFKATTQEELDAAAKDLTSEDPSVRAAAVRKLAGSALEEQNEKARVAEAKALGKIESLKFLTAHVGDYNNCEANNNMLAAYINENQLEWTQENLEIAFGNLESQLAPVIKRQPEVTVPAPTVENPPATTQPAATAQAVPAATPAVTVAPVAPAAAAPAAPVVTAPPATNTPAVPARRPGVNGGLQPGTTLSGVAPLEKTPELTKKDIAKMSAEEMKRRHKMDPKFYDKVNALFAKK